jgi:hypothetical protein
MNQPSKETKKLLLRLIRPTTEKILKERNLNLKAREKEEDNDNSK